MRTRQVVVVLLPGRIDVIVYERSRQTDIRRLAISTDGDAGEWAKTIRRSGVTLEKLVDELGVTGCDARVLYRSPTQSVDLTSFAVRSPAQALEAASLSCADSLPYSAMSAVCEGVVIGRDAAGDPRQTHVVVGAEREDIAEAIVHLVEEAGLTFQSATPLDAAVMANFVGRQLRSKATHQGSLYVGEHTSFFVVASGGTLLFDRRIDLGLESIAAALTSPLNVRGRSETIELTMEEARTILHRHGVPDRDAVVHEQPTLTGGQVIPLLQPVLQRYIVELRQSLRFGLSEGERSNLTIRVTGPGATIPGLAELIGQELAVETRRDESYNGDADWTTPGAAGELADAMCEPRVLAQLNLLPRGLNQNRRVQRLRRWLWTGGAAALALVAMDALRQHVRLTSAREQAAIYGSQLEDLAALEQNAERLRSVMDATRALHTTVSAQIGTDVHLGGCLKEISVTIPDSIRLTTISFGRESDAVIGTIKGFAFSERGTTDVAAFIEALRRSSLFAQVELGNINTGSLSEREGERFEARVVVVGVPRGPARLTLAGREPAEREEVQ